MTSLIAHEEHDLGEVLLLVIAGLRALLQQGHQDITSCTTTSSVQCGWQGMVCSSLHWHGHLLHNFDWPWNPGPITFDAVKAQSM